MNFTNFFFFKKFYFFTFCLFDVCFDRGFVISFYTFRSDKEEKGCVSENRVSKVENINKDGFSKVNFFLEFRRFSPNRPFCFFVYEIPFKMADNLMVELETAAQILLVS